MHWIEAFRRRMCLEARELAAIAGVMETLIVLLENRKGAITHPLIANRLAELCGASAEQRDAIVAEQHRGTRKPDPDKAWKRPTPPAPAPKLPETERPQIPKGTGQRGGLNKRAVVKLDSFGREIGRYEGVLNAARLEGITPAVICRRCNRSVTGREMTVQGVTWRYADEWDLMTESQRIADMEGRYRR